ncbi:4'-phosphopantetheinyl transferase superfamily, partial [Syncephalis pseudoplumigaleata]
LFDCWLSLLPSNESDRIRQYRQQADRWRSLVGRLLARCWLIQQFHCAWSDIRMAPGPYGKPKYTASSTPSFDVSISHHRDWIVFAGLRAANTCASASIGVDVADTILP